MRKGIALSHLKKFKDAVRDFNKIITDNPKNYHAYYQKGRALFDSGNTS